MDWMTDELIIVFHFSACFVSFCLTDAVDLGSPDELMDISEVDEGVWPGGVGPDMTPPTITISNSVTTLNLGAKAMKKCRLGVRTSKDKEAGPLTTGRAASENAELSVKRLTLTSSQSVPKAGALTSLTRTASAVFSRSFEQVASGNAPPSSNHTASEAGHYSCSLQEEGLGYLSPGPNHTQRSPSISVHLGSDLWTLCNSWLPEPLPLIPVTLHLWPGTPSHANCNGPQTLPWFFSLPCHSIFGVFDSSCCKTGLLPCSIQTSRAPWALSAPLPQQSVLLWAWWRREVREFHLQLHWFLVVHCCREIVPGQNCTPSQCSSLFRWMHLKLITKKNCVEKYLESILIGICLPCMAFPYIHPYLAQVCQRADVEYVWACLSVRAVCVYVQLFLEKRLLIDTMNKVWFS